MIKVKLFKFEKFSNKQKIVLTWWNKNSPLQDKDMIICDGSVRAGKTVSMVLSFIIWAMENFDNEQFFMAGKTILSLNRNVVTPLKKILLTRGYKYKHLRTDNNITIYKNGGMNTFYLFGGKDEGSQDLIQGLTAAGGLFDEVVLMPETFVNQAIARCSVDKSKIWFNCNPSSPYHWFKKEFIDNLIKKNAFRVHFTMKDNNSLSKEIIKRYESMYSGIFYKRYIQGKWVMAEGVVYDMFGEENKIKKQELLFYTFSEYYISIDYGTQNPCVFLLWGKSGEKWYCIKEYYYDGREKQVQKTDSEYLKDLLEFVESYKSNLVFKVILDPSSSSFKTELKKHGISVTNAKNEVLEGLRLTQSLISNKEIYFSDDLINTFKEFSSYSWDNKKTDNGKDEPIKKNDHAMDSIRYFCNTVLTNKNKLKSINIIDLGI
ncbi:MAG: PBSX family phage terminase large subunit [Cetobacterium sp.]